MSQLTLFYKSATRKVTIIAAIAMVGLTALVSAFFIAADTASNTYATQLESEVSATVDGTHYVSLTAADVTFSASPTGSTPVTDKQTVNVSVETNVTGGASLYLASATNTNALYKDGNPTNSNLPHIAASTATVESPATLDNLSPNTWAYSTDNTNYQGVPTSSDTNSPSLIADIDGTTTGTTSGGVTSATIPIYYAAKIDTSIPAGSYASSVTYSAVVDGGIVTSAELTSITVDNEPAEAMQAEAENVILVTTNLKTNTYGTPRVYYTGTTSSTTGGSNSTFYSECGNVIVGSNSEGYMTVTCTTTPTTEATNVTLHIVPKGEPSTGTAANNNLTGDPFCTDGTYNANTSECEAGEWKWGSFVISVGDIEEPVMNMQDFTGEMCTHINTGEQIQLKDSRDGKVYWVGKLTDNNCWMTQNLDLDLSTDITLTPTDTDTPIDWTPRKSTATTIPEDHSTIDSYDPGVQYYEGTGSEHYHAGNYYSLYDATAGHDDVSDSPQSICPKGWKLPSQNQFQALIDSGLTGNNFMNAPYYLLRGGSPYLGSMNLVGSEGRYWSSTREYFSLAYGLDIGSGSVEIADWFDVGNLQSVRCVAAG